MNPILGPVDDYLNNQEQKIALLQSQVDAFGAVTVWDHLEFDPWLLAPGTAANTGSTGSTMVATQGTPGVNCAWSKLQPNGPYADAYWYRKLGPNPKKTKFTYELSLMLPTAADAAASQCIELDIQQVITGMGYNPGFQWDFAENQWRIWNRYAKEKGLPNPWASTGVSSPRWTPGTWMRSVFEVHRDDSHIYYDAMTVNGVRTALGQSFPSVPLALPDMLNVGLQMDGNKAGNAYLLYRDAIRFTAA